MLLLSLLEEAKMLLLMS